MRVGLDRSRFPGSHVTPGALARKEVFETALDGPARTQSDVFLVFSGTGNPLVKTVFLRGQRKLTKNSSTDFTLLATIVTIDDDDDDDIYLKDSPTGTKPWSRGSP